MLEVEASCPTLARQKLHIELAFILSQKQNKNEKK